jgi:hypothetical protein
MPEPIELCWERVGEEHIRCVALAGDQPGLGVGAGGRITWREQPDDALARICVTGDDRLALLRGSRAPGMVLSRGGRRLDVPAGRPVVLRDQDLLTVDAEGGACQLRLHVHGAATTVAAPAPVERRTSRWLVATAAALALGAGAFGGTGDGGGDAAADAQIEVRDQPPCSIKPGERP